MVGRLAVLALVVALVPGAGSVGGHYVPHAGDSFTFYETITVTDGTGNYTGYTETTAVNGTVTVTAIAPNGTENASYSYAEHYWNDTGANYEFTSAGTFSFSAASFLYVRGTDNQTGYTHPFVWFYMNASLPVGSTFYLLNSEMTVESRNTSFGLDTTAGTYVATLSADGVGAYEREDSYGDFTASYTWQAYFDPSTGYVVGYVYREQDMNAQRDGFLYADILGVTGTTYRLTPGTAPASSGPSDALVLYLVVAAVVVVVVIALAYALRRRSRRPPPLPRHPVGGRPQYGAMPPGPAPPPISLVPSDQPRIQQVVVKEVVKVNCRYCGSLIDSTAEKCPFCGATRS